jgi:hypothetical protein
MFPFAKLALLPAPQSSKIAERLLAHARLCRQIAGASWNEETAKTLAQLADDCARAAAKIEPGRDPNAPIH